MSWNGLIDGSVVNFAYHEASDDDATMTVSQSTPGLAKETLRWVDAINASLHQHSANDL